MLRSLLFALFFYPMTVIAVLAATLAAPFSRPALVSIALMWTRYFRWCAATLLGLHARIEGPVPDGPVLVAAKHQSMYETMVLMPLLGGPVPILKRELADIPFWGWVAQRYGCIPVDRSGGAGALRRMVKAAEAAVAEDRIPLIYPEGTRVPPGHHPALQPGFAGLYRALGLPVVPVALDTGRFWPRSFVKRPGVTTFRFGEPIPPGLGRIEIETRVHSAINALES